VKLAVRGLPGSATPGEQLADSRIDRLAIAEAVKRLL
jgi:transketolase